MELKNLQNQIFTEDQIQNFAGFFNTIKQIHTRLIREGYKIEDGQIIEPSINKTRDL